MIDFFETYTHKSILLHNFQGAIYIVNEGTTFIQWPIERKHGVNVIVLSFQILSEWRNIPNPRKMAPGPGYLNEAILCIVQILS